MTRQGSVGTAALHLLVTGGEGFVGRHVLRAIADGRLPGARVTACARLARTDPELGAMRGLDITDQAMVDEALAELRPSHILHLAGYAATSGDGSPRHTLWAANAIGPLNIADAIRRIAPDCRLVFVGSGLVYGDGAAVDRPIAESAPLAPCNAYAASKAAADLALGAEALAGLRVVRVRPFNHTGPGQSEAFVIPRFAAQIARAEAGHQPPCIVTGPLSAERDYLDVADVVDAYLRCIERFDRLPNGAVINVASGIPRVIGDVLNRLTAMSRIPLTVASRDSGATAAAAFSRYAGDASRARDWLGWQPVCDFDATLARVLDHWRRQVAMSSAPASQ